MNTDHRVIGSSDHQSFMRHALELARRNLGQTWPNPAVGAVVVKGEKIIAEGWTAKGGRPHAEPQALAQAGAAAKGATLYVTLEPCAHRGKTPPCTETIIASGIARVVIACRDPHGEVNGRGVAALKQAGIEVIENVCAAEAREINRGFFSVVERGRPYVALKIATSADGKIAYTPQHHLPLPNPPPQGGRENIRWITGEPAREYGHLLRAEHDAILTGIGTVLADDPLLTCRLPGMEDRSPVRVVFDRKLRLPPDSKLAKTAKDVPVWVMAEQPDAGRRMPDVRILAADSPTGALHLLAGQGITRVLVEAGQKLSSAFLRSGTVDRIYWFRAPDIIGKSGLEAFEPGAWNAAHWQREETKMLGRDTLEVYYPAERAED